MSGVRARIERALVCARLRRDSADAIVRYGDALLQANRSVNLTGAGDWDELLAHVLDSLTVAPMLAAPYVDVGSGGGLPAIPSALAAGIGVTMIEAIKKKAAFLRTIAPDIALDARVLDVRVERAAREPDLRESFASATARAVAGASTVLEYLAPLLRVGGEALLQRGAPEPGEREAFADAALVLGCEVAEEMALEGERRIVRVRKIAPVVDRFPRRDGIPEKRPLGSR